MMAAVAALIGLNFLMDYVPDIARVFERFQTAGSDNASLLRILMWDRARSIFNQNQYWESDGMDFDTNPA